MISLGLLLWACGTGATSTSDRGSLDEGSDPSSRTHTTRQGEVAPGSPIVLVDELYHATRFVLDGDDVWVLHHPGYRDPTRAGSDEILRVPRSGGRPTTVLRSTTIEGFVLDGGRIWTNSTSQGSVRSFDVGTGAESFRVDFPGGSPYQLAQNSRYVFTIVVPTSRVVRFDKKDGSQLELFFSEDESSATPQWLLATEEAVFFAHQPKGHSQPAVMRVEADGSGARELAVIDNLTGLGLAGSEILAADHETGRLWAIPQVSGAARSFGSIHHAWSITADNAFAYVSSQPLGGCLRGVSGAVTQTPLDGGGSTLLAKGQACPSMLLTADDGLYWVNNGFNSGDEVASPLGGGSLVKLPRR